MSNIVSPRPGGERPSGSRLNDMRRRHNPGAAGGFAPTSGSIRTSSK